MMVTMIGELDRAVERALHVAGAHLGEQVDEPVQRQSLHREHEAAAHILERQDVDADHRPVEREHIEDEDREQDVEGPGPAAGARRDRMCVATACDSRRPRSSGDLLADVDRAQDRR